MALVLLGLVGLEVLERLETEDSCQTEYHLGEVQNEVAPLPRLAVQADLHEPSLHHVLVGGDVLKLEYNEVPKRRSDRAQDVNSR